MRYAKDKKRIKTFLGNEDLKDRADNSVMDCLVEVNNDAYADNIIKSSISF